MIPFLPTSRVSFNPTFRRAAGSYIFAHATEKNGVETGSAFHLSRTMSCRFRVNTEFDEGLRREGGFAVQIGAKDI